MDRRVVRRVAVLDTSSLMPGDHRFAKGAPCMTTSDRSENAQQRDAVWGCVSRAIRPMPRDTCRLGGLRVPSGAVSDELRGRLHVACLRTWLMLPGSEPERGCWRATNGGKHTRPLGARGLPRRPCLSHQPAMIGFAQHVVDAESGDVVIGREHRGSSRAFVDGRHAPLGRIKRLSGPRQLSCQRCDTSQGAERRKH